MAALRPDVPPPGNYRFNTGMQRVSTNTAAATGVPVASDRPQQSTRVTVADLLRRRARMGDTRYLNKPMPKVATGG
jgi:hypothetical protein